MITVDITNSKKQITTYELEFPMDIEDNYSLFLSTYYNRKSIEYKKIKVENCRSEMTALNQAINKIRSININDLNFLSLCLEKMSQDERLKYNAIVEYESIRNNIESIDELIDIVFELDCYLYVEQAKDIEELTIKLAGKNVPIVQEQLIETMKMFKKRHEGIFGLYNNKNGYVEMEKKEQIENIRKIEQYEIRSKEDFRYKFKTNIIKALGLANTLGGNLYQKRNLLFSSELDKKTKIDQIESLTGRYGIGIISDDILNSFGIRKTYRNDEKILDLQIKDEQANEDEVEM